MARKRGGGTGRQMEEREKQEIDSDQEGDFWNLYINISINIRYQWKRLFIVPPSGLSPLLLSKNILSRMNGCPARGFLSNLLS